MTSPNAVLTTARDVAPVFFSPILNSWIVTRYDDIATILRQPVRFSSWEILSITELLSPEVVELFGDEIPMEGALIGVDPPDHTRLRRVLEPALSTRGVAPREAMIRSVCEELVAAMTIENGGDLLAQFTYPLALTVVSRVIGIPDEDVTSFHAAVEEWTSLSMALLTGVSLDEQLAMATHILEMHRLISRLIEMRYRDPRDDLLTVIAQGRHEYRLTPHEMLSLVPGLFLAGHEAPTHVLTNMLWRLLSVPERWESLLNDPSLGPRFLDETLRCDPSAFGMWRIVTEDVVLAGRHIAAGQKLFLVYYAANHDGTHYVNPDAFSIERGRIAPHLGLGRGIHHCIGAPLARIESRVMLEVLAQRLPGLRLAEGFTPTYQPHPFLRGMAQLPVTW